LLWGPYKTHKYTLCACVCVWCVSVCVCVCVWCVWCVCVCVVCVCGVWVCVCGVCECVCVWCVSVCVVCVCGVWVCVCVSECVCVCVSVCVWVCVCVCVVCECVCVCTCLAETKVKCVSWDNKEETGTTCTVQQWRITLPFPTDILYSDFKNLGAFLQIWSRRRKLCIYYTVFCYPRMKKLPTTRLLFT
jgi:hypothetical protein